jgi:hypothetical protein
MIMNMCNPYRSKFSSGLSRSDTITAIASLHVIEAFNPHRYSICCEISFDVGSIGIPRNTKTFTAKREKKNNNNKLILCFFFPNTGWRNKQNLPAFRTKLESSWQSSIIGIKSLDTMFHLQTCLNTSRVCGSSRLKNLSKSFKLSAKGRNLKLNMTNKTTQTIAPQ